jgi:phage-related protein
LDVFDLVAKIRLDSSEYESGVGKAKGTMSTLASGVGKGLATVAKVGAAAVSAGVAGVTALTKMGVEGYAQYEQLVGGVETLFKESGNAVKAYAENAYKTSGMSANQYMETVTSFSASLIQSLDGDTAKAAEKADLAITDMSDNANKMGSDLSTLQTAYAGFAKGQFTLLDNLKLGYGGTQEEMKRLLKDAQAISGVKYDISSYADIVDAIHVIQTEMDITGTTAREASTTIEGSLSMMKASWENLVVGMADSDANMDVLINNFVESTATAAQNILPRIEQTLVGIGALIEKLAPVIAEALPRLIEAVLPSLLAAGTSLVTALANGAIEAAPAVWQAVLDAISTILVDGLGVSADTAAKVVEGLQSAVTAVGAAIEYAKENITDIVGWLGSFASVVGTVTAAIGLYNAVQAVKQAMDAANVTTLWGLVAAKIADAAATFAMLAPYIAIVAAIAAVIAIIVLCVKHWDEITAAAGNAWEFIKTKTSEAVAAISAWFNGLISTVVGAWNSITSAISGAISSIHEWISGFIGRMIEAGTSLITSLQEGIANKFAELFTLVGGCVTDNIINPISDMGTELYNAGAKLLNKFWDGLKSVWSSIASWWDGLKLKDKDANVNVNKNSGGYATGLNYVPYDEFPAILHRGEAVLTAAEARVWRANGLGGATPAMAGGITINQYIQSVPQTAVDLANTTEAYFEQARWML